MPAYLDTIIAAHRAARDAEGSDVEELMTRVGAAGAVRSFRGAVDEAAARGGMAVISEIKRRSPSKGDLDPTLDPVAVAKEYEAGGAACLSVLTDVEFFGGSAADLAAARAACSLPVLRKDFTVSGRDVVEARLMGADAVLLIVAALTDSELTSFLDLARRCDLAALVEVHDEPELARALDVGAEMIGVNQRDLHTFEVDHRLALRLGASIPDHVVAVAESGIEGPDDVRRLGDAGYQRGVGGRAAGAVGRPARRGGRAARSRGMNANLSAGWAPDGLFVKICGITSEADALLAVGMGATAVGFVFAPSPRQMAPAAVADIVKRLPHETITVGVFRDEARQRVVDIADQIGLGAVQLHGMESAEDTQWIARRCPADHQGLPGGPPVHRPLHRLRSPVHV